MKEVRYLITGKEDDKDMFYNMEYDFFSSSFLSGDYFKKEETAKGILEEIDSDRHPTIKDMKVIKTEIELKVL